MTQPTPGPWKIHSEKANDAPGAPLVSEIRGNGGSRVVVTLGRMYTEEVKANARLIAQAPALLKFVKRRVCGSTATNEQGEHVCVHHWDDLGREQDCTEARAVLKACEP